ncbi:MAG: ASCH domain-containing protein [Bryobacteraceae bacterium]|jgi:hypothetical protein
MLRALLIHEEYVEQILKRKKTWEIRGSRIAIRDLIGLIPSGSGTITGVCEVVDCIGPLSVTSFRTNAAKAGMRPSEAKLGHYSKTYAWVLKRARRLERPVRYRHPSGAVIWVNLEGRVERAIRTQL